MKASLLCAALAGSMLLTGCDRSEPMTPASGVSAEQRIIDRSAAAFSSMRSDPEFRALDDYLPRARGVLTIGFLGFDGGVLKNQVDECLWLPTERGAYGLVESGHSLFCHVLTTCLPQDRPETERPS